MPRSPRARREGTCQVQHLAPATPCFPPSDRTVVRSLFGRTGARESEGRNRVVSSAPPRVLHAERQCPWGLGADRRLAPAENIAISTAARVAQGQGRVALLAGLDNRVQGSRSSSACGCRGHGAGVSRLARDLTREFFCYAPAHLSISPSLLALSRSHFCSTRPAVTSAQHSAPRALSDQPCCCGKTAVVAIGKRPRSTRLST